MFGDMPVATLDDVEPPERAIRYSARDADATRRLFDPVSERVKATRQSKVWNLDMQVIPMLSKMMQVGMKVDRDHFADVSIDLNREMVELRLSGDGRKRAIQIKQSNAEWNLGIAD